MRSNNGKRLMLLKLLIHYKRVPNYQANLYVGYTKTQICENDDVMHMYYMFSHLPIWSQYIAIGNNSDKIIINKTTVNNKEIGSNND